MCGIAGMVRREGAVSEPALLRMAEQLRHRGPEDSGTYVADRFGIAHTRLAIIDLAGGHQPLFDAAQRYALVCNGEIYNYVELRRELQTLGHQFQTGSDSEVALHGFAQWGAGSFTRLNGMFAYALYDHARRELWLVRDRLGIKPLFVAELPDRVLYASELKALLPLLPQTRVHGEALAQYFQNQFSSGAETIIEGVRRVLPGTALKISADLKIETHRYWLLQDLAAPRERSFEDAIEEWEPLFEQVMREHMRSDVPFGVFLSGGVDSAVLLAQLKRLHTQPVRTYSIGWQDTRMSDELDDAESVARRFNSEHRSLRLDSRAVFHRLPRATWAADELMRDYACLPTLALAEAAGHELKIVFSGEGGDEAFAGYGRYRPDSAERWFKSLRYPGSGGFRVRAELDPRWVKKLFVPALQPALARYRQPVIDIWAETPRDWSALQRRQAVDLRTNLPDDLLVKADRMLMAYSVEGRVPFLDHRVVEFGMRLPDALKVSGKAGKVFIKRWAEGFLPREHLWKHKRGFHVPVSEWLRGPFLDALAQRLPRSAAIEAWCQPEAVQALLARQAARGDVTREVFSLLQFAIWYRLFVSEPGALPGAEEDPLAWL